MIKIKWLIIGLIFLGLPCWAYDNFRKNLHQERLKFWKEKGFNPKVIYDIGAYQGTWSQAIYNVFPQANFFLFEANKNNELYLSALSFPYYIALLGDQEREVTFYTNNSTGDSVFIEQTRYYQENHCQKHILSMTTLEMITKKHQLPLPDLIKFDVQGAEKLIIQGSPKIIGHAEVIILETKVLEYNKNAPLVYEIMTVMNNLGYALLDIVECNYLPTGELSEMDLLFAKKSSSLIKKGLLIE